MNIRKIISYVIGWRIAIFLLPILVIPLNQVFIVWSNFDGLRYLNLAREGYGTPNTYYSYSLFPFYHHLIKIFSPLGGYLSSGLIVSNLCLLLSVIVFWKLVRLDLKPKTVSLALVLLAVFPSSFILGAVYSESLFLFLSLASFYLARKDRFILASVFAFIAAYTRPIGLVLWLALLVEYFIQHPISKKSLLSPKVLFLLLPPLGTIIFLKYIQINTSDVSNFLPSVPHKIVLLHQVFIRYGKMLLLVDHTSSLFWVVLSEFFVGTISLLAIVFSYRHLRFSYWVYLFVSYAIPSFWGTFVGFPRYMLVVFPLFIYLSNFLEKSHPYLRYIYLITSGILLTINLLLFAQGVFVG